MKGNNDKEKAKRHCWWNYVEVLAGGVFDGRKVGHPHSCVLASRDPRDWCHCISLSGRRKGVNTRDVVMYREKGEGLG